MAPAMPDLGALRAWVDFAIHERHPDYAAALVVAAGARNEPTDAHSERRLARGGRPARTRPDPRRRGRAPGRMAAGVQRVRRQAEQVPLVGRGARDPRAQGRAAAPTRVRFRICLDALARAT
jgi:hypothetical protein